MIKPSEELSPLIICDQRCSSLLRSGLTNYYIIDLYHLSISLIAPLSLTLYISPIAPRLLSYSDFEIFLNGLDTCT